jgi:hypothetical protein
MNMMGFNEATKGHTIGFRKPVSKKAADLKHIRHYKSWTVFCTCGWEEKRPKVMVDGKSKTLPMDAFKAMGDKHLYGIWKDAQQLRIME